MTFNQYAENKMGPILKRFKYKLIETSENYLHYRSANIGITLSHDKRERSNSLWIEIDHFGYPINDKIVKHLFNVDLRIDNTIQEEFIDNITLLFEGVGADILAKDFTTLNLLKSFVSLESYIYTNSLTRRQVLSKAEDAWRK